MATFAIFPDFSNPLVSMFDYDDTGLHSIASVTVSTATRYTYTSTDGFTVRLNGTGFSFDGSSSPDGGTVTSIQINKGLFPVANLSDIGFDFADVLSHVGSAAFWSSLLSEDDVIIGSSINDDFAVLAAKIS